MEMYLHIAYDETDNHDLKYAFKSAQGWQLVTIASASPVGSHLSLALGEDGSRHISFYDLALGDLKYAFYAPQAPIGHSVYLPIALR
jgi:hypothetical protein